MRRRCRIKSESGLSLIELLFAMGILVFVLGAVVIEFTAVVQNFRFQDAHLDADTSARIAMAKIGDVMRMGTPNVTESGCAKTASKCTVLATYLNESGGNSSVSFYEVTDDHSDPGHLSDSGMTVDPNSGEPLPQYQVVTIYLDAVNNQLDECRVKDVNFTRAQPCGQAAPFATPLILAHDITGFNVTPVGCPTAQLNCQAETGTLQIDLTASNNTDHAKGATTSGQTKEVANVSNTLYFSSWKAFHK